VAQKPKLADFLDQMKANIADDIPQCSHREVNIKATTTEKLGFVGREEGIAAHAVVLLKMRDDLGD
jgi:2-C-methyl-D-erythritol 2,4-cyclodiphosphate synthase